MTWLRVRRSPVALTLMGTLRHLVEERRDEIRAIVRRHRGRSVAVFGSVARGQEHRESDVDLLVEFEAGSSLFDLMRMEDELGSLLGVTVDVVSVGGLRDRDDHVLREAVTLA